MKFIKESGPIEDVVAFIYGGDLIVKDTDGCWNKIFSNGVVDGGAWTAPPPPDAQYFRKGDKLTIEF